MSLCTWGRLGLGLGFFIAPFIVCHMVAQQLLDLVANANANPCLRVRVKVFIVLFIVCHMAAQQLLDLVANATAGPCLRVRVKVFIVPFIVRHMAAQQLLDLVANATACPCFRVTVRVRVFHQTIYSAPHGWTVNNVQVVKSQFFKLPLFSQNRLK